MPRSVNGFCGVFTSTAELTTKYPPVEHAGCSANLINTPGGLTNSTITTKYWCDGISWKAAVVFNDTGTALIAPDGGLLALTEVTPFVTRTTTGQAFTGACELAGYDCIVAAGNITIYDSLSAGGTIVVPTTALSVGRIEFTYKRALTLGCHVVLSGAATVNVLVG